MHRSLALVTAAAITFGLAACGDDDDDAAGDDATLPPVELNGDTAAEAPAGTEARAAEGTGAGDDVAADCETLLQAFTELEAEELPDPQPGEELTDEQREASQTAAEALRDLDLQSDEVQEVRDVLAGLFEDIAGAASYTEEMNEQANAALEPFTDLCAPG